MTKKEFIGIVVLVLFMLLFIMPAVSALSLAGARLGTITYQPGASFSNHYTIFGTDQPVIVIVDGGEQFPGISVSEVIDNEFELLVNFPEEVYVAPGSYNFALTVVENASQQEGISSQVAVSKVFEVVVYSYEKDIRASFSIPNINAGRNVTFQLTVQSLGYPDIEKVYGQIALYNSSRQEVGRLVTETKSLPGLASLSFQPAYDTDNFLTGTYSAKAVVWYDGKSKTVNSTFLIGSMDLIVNNYSTEFNPGFNEFSVIVTNNWGNILRNVYARLFIQGQQLVQTPSMELEPWQQGKLQAILNIESPPGTYAGVLKLYFEGESKEIPVAIMVLPAEPAMEKQEVEKEIQIAGLWGFIPALLVAVILLIVILIYLSKKKNEKKGKEEW